MLSYLVFTININFLIFGVILILLKRENYHSNIFLGILLLLISYVNFILSFYVFKEVFIQFPHLIRTHIPFLFCIPPLYYFYIKSLFDQHLKIRRSIFLHFLPALSIAVFFAPFYLGSSTTKLYYVLNDFYPYHYLQAGLFYTLFTIYFIIVIIHISKYIFNIRNLVGINKKITVWCIEFIVITVMALVFTFIPLFFSFKIQSILYVPLFNALIYLIILVKMVFQPEIFRELKELKQLIEENKRYKKELINSTEAELLLSKLREAMEHSRLFLNQHLSITQLSELLQIPTHHISRVINERLNTNFNDFINYYRIEEAKKRIVSSQINYLTIEGIAKEVGFNSKTTFYSAFKKFTSQTPQQFLKKVNRKFN